MKRIFKISIIILIIIFICLGIMSIIIIDNNDKVYAASNSSTSDLQLLARAINGEARGEPYEGQVAVRCCYSKSCKKFSVFQIQ